MRKIALSAIHRILHPIQILDFMSMISLRLKKKNSTGPNQLQGSGFMDTDQIGMIQSEVCLQIMC